MKLHILTYNQSEVPFLLFLPYIKVTSFHDKLSLHKKEKMKSEHMSVNKDVLLIGLHNVLSIVMFVLMRCFIYLFLDKNKLFG